LPGSSSYRTALAPTIRPHNNSNAITVTVASLPDVPSDLPPPDSYISSYSFAPTASPSGSVISGAPFTSRLLPHTGSSHLSQSVSSTTSTLHHGPSTTPVGGSSSSSSFHPSHVANSLMTTTLEVPVSLIRPQRKPGPK
jgi:hypothetical protein